MLQVVSFVVMLLTATVNSQNNAGFGGDIAVPVSFPESLLDPSTISPSQTPPTTPPRTTTTPIPTFSGPLIVDRAENEASLNLKGVNSNENPVGGDSNLPSSGSSSTCSFSINVDDIYEPKNESFTYPRAIVTQALKDTAAEMALKSLQNAKQRIADINSGRSVIPTGIDFPSNLDGSDGKTQLNLLPPASDTDLLNTLNGNVNNNDNVRNPNGNNLAFATSDPSQLSNPNNGGQLNNILGGFNAGNIQKNNFNLNPPTAQNSQNFNQNFDHLFPSNGNNPRFPQSSFFGPERFGNRGPNHAVSSPFGFYGFGGLSPLTSAQGGNQATGNGNDVSYNVNGGQGGQPRPFDGVNPFDIGNKFPIPRTIRRKRQATSGRDIKGACESEPILLREYKNYGDRCYVVYPELQQLMFVTCSNEACLMCNYPEGSSRCIPEMRGVSVWAYCENGPSAQKVDMDFISLPIVCSCKVMTCS